MAQAYTPPTDYASGLADVLKEAGNIYQAKKAAGYPTYTGPQIAGFAPEELAAMQGISSLVGAGQSYFTPATALTMGTARQFTPTEAATYMSPYQQAVVDVEKREAIRRAQPQMQQIGAQAAGAGGFGGSRQAILEAEAQRNLQQQLGDIQTRGSQAAYDTAQRAFESQLARERQAASGLATLGQVAPRQALTELTALSGVGEAQRGMTQAGFDIAKQQYEQQQQYPYELLGQYQSTLYGYPYQAFQQFQPVAKPSAAQNLAGILGAAGKIASGFGLFNTGGRVAFKSGGGLSGMIQRMAEGESVGSDEEDMTPLGQMKTKADYQNALLNYLTKMESGLDEYSTAAEEALAEQQKLAEERKAKLEKKTGNLDYISDLLIGFAQADPETSMGVQLASAAGYAGEQREAIKDELAQIQQDLASGKLTQAEANMKILKLKGDILTGLQDTYKSNLKMSDVNTLRKIAADATGATYDERTGILIGTSDAKAAHIKLLNDMTKAYEIGGIKDALDIAENYGKESNIPAGVTKTTKIDVTDTATGQKADELIQGLEE